CRPHRLRRRRGDGRRRARAGHRGRVRGRAHRGAGVRPMAEPLNPVHAHSNPQTRWTTVNVAEALQGVQTPLSYGLWAPAMEHAIQGAFVRFGAIRQVTEPRIVDDGFSAPFYGRAAGNMSYIAGFADLLPGTNGDVMEEKVFGKPPGPAKRKPLSIYRGYPRILTHLPRACWRAPR